MAEAVGWISVYRGLTDDERRVLRWLLTRGARITGTDAVRAAAFVRQLDVVRVVGICPCGCPTIALSLESPHLAVGDVTGTLADVECRSPEGTEIGSILRAKGGSLSDLEAYARDGIVPFHLPSDIQLAALE